MTKQELISLFEHVRYQIVVFPKGTASPLPESVGSGFMLDYKGRTFFVTADHVVNTHDNGVRKIKDCTITISTNIPALIGGKLCTMMIPIGGFYSFYQFKVDINNGSIGNMPLFDAAFSILDDWQIKKVCITCEVKVEGADVPIGDSKIHLKEENIIEANNSDIYSVFGRVRFALQKVGDNEILVSQQTFKTNLKLVGEDSTQNYYILQSPNPVVYEDWAGLSGSAVLNQDGKLIGVACAVDTSGSRFVYVKKIRRVLSLMDGAMQTEQINDSSTEEYTREY